MNKSNVTPIGGTVPVAAGTGSTVYERPRLPESAAPVALSGMRRVDSLSLCDNYNKTFSNCPLPSFRLDPCDPAYPEGGLPDKCSKTVWSDAMFRPVFYHDVEEAPCVDPLVDPQEMADRVVTEATAWALTTVLQNGGGFTTTTLENANPDPACDLSASAAVDPCVGIAALMRAMAGRGIGRFTIHAPIHTLPILETAGLVRNIGGVYRTSGSVPINFGVGLTGVGPDSTGNIDNVADDEVYLYTTRGAVEYNIGEPLRFVPDGTLVHPRTNTSMAEAARQAIVVFDPGCTYAIRVCLAKASCCG